ncbi:MAG: alpha-ketoglutarate decarboxylase [bacterium]
MKLKLLQTKLILALLICFLTSAENLNAQEHTKLPSEFWSKVRFGGGIGLGFGNGFFSGSLSPNAIYDFNPYFSAGVGLNGIYASQRNIAKSTIVGASIIGLANPYPEIQISGEFEQLFVSRNFDQNFVSNPDEDYWYPALFLGAGYRTGNVTVGARIDVLYDEDRSIYTSPWLPFVRVFF